MSQNRKKALLVSLPEIHFDYLRKMAAKHNYENPGDHPMTAAKLAMEIICKHLNELVCEAEPAQTEVIENGNS